jgi:putative methionine-R-sulfoxide reductase with GAF domain
MEQSSHSMQDAPSTTGMTPGAFPNLPELLRFPAEDKGKSLEEAARRDMESALHLLAERAQYVMGASGVAIALRAGDSMICRASVGPSAPPLETQLQIDSGLTAESIRSRQILRCDDAESDARVDRASCRALGVKSVMVTPLLRQQQSVGVFELLAERSYAFEERDVTVLQRLSEMVLTVLEHADVASQVDYEADAGPENAGKAERTKEAVPVLEEEETEEGLISDLTHEVGSIQKCGSCGFPVSAGRSVCLDCEKAGRSKTDAADASQPEYDAFLSRDAAPEKHGWFASAFFVTAILGAVLAVVWFIFKLH